MALDININPLKGAANVQRIALTPSKGSVSAGDTITLSLNAVDKFGNRVADIDPVDIQLTDGGNVLLLAKEWNTVPQTVGTFDAKVTLTQVKTYTLMAKLGSQTQTASVTVTPVTGVGAVAKMDLTSNTPVDIGKEFTLTLALYDTYGNPVLGVKSSEIELTHATKTQSVTWVEGSNGTYTTKFTLTQSGKQPLTVKVNQKTSTHNAQIHFPTGKINVDNYQITSNVANNQTVYPGDEVLITLTATDQYGNGVKGLQRQDISLKNLSAGGFVSPTWTEVAGKNGEYRASINLEKVAVHRLASQVNYRSKPLEVTVRPFTEVDKVNHVVLTADKLSMEVNQKILFNVTPKDTYGNTVLVQPNVIKLHNANGNIAQPVWQLRNEVFEGGLSISQSGQYVVTAKVGDKTSTRISLAVSSGIPSFESGKSAFSVNTDEIEVGHNTNITVTLVLKDAHGSPITGKKPVISATAGNIAPTMTEVGNGEYTSTFNNSAIGKSKLAINGHSINYAGSVPEITVVTYGKSEVHTIKNKFSFAMDSGFPNTGFEGAQFRITVPVGSPTDYHWTIDEKWLTINSEGIVTLNKKPIPESGRNVMLPKIKGEPKSGTGYKRTVKYEFTLKRWYTNHKIKGLTTVNSCTLPSQLVAKADLAYGRGTNRATGKQLFNEWGHNQFLTDISSILFWTRDNQSQGENSVYVPMYDYEKSLTLFTDKYNREYSRATLMCVEDL